MLCPIDQTALVMSDRQGVEIDYCPTCRGVWLDRGELDKIIERSNELNARATAPPARAAAVPTQGQAYDRDREYRDRDDDDDEYTIDKNGRRKKKRGSFLDDLFDF